MDPIKYAAEKRLTISGEHPIKWAMTRGWKIDGRINPDEYLEHNKVANRPSTSTCGGNSKSL